MLAEMPAIMGAVSLNREVATGPWLRSLLDINCYSAVRIGAVEENAIQLELQGEVDPAFATVADTFMSGFSAGRDVGAALGVVVAGELVVVVPSVSDFIIHNFSNNIDSQKICNLFNQYFIYLINRENFEFDNRLYGALNIILQKFGVLNVEKDLDTGISPRQLRRLFEFYVGTTPKTFSKVVRFQNILRAKPSRQSLKQNKLFFDVGYYDQAHFIKEFKNFYGVTPSKAFGR